MFWRFGCGDTCATVLLFKARSIPARTAEDCQQSVQPRFHSPQITDVAPMDGIGVMAEVVVGDLLQPFQLGADGGDALQLRGKGGKLLPLETGLSNWSVKLCPVRLMTI